MTVLRHQRAGRGFGSGRQVFIIAVVFTLVHAVDLLAQTPRTGRQIYESDQFASESALMLTRAAHTVGQ